MKNGIGQRVLIRQMWLQGENLRSQVSLRLLHRSEVGGEGASVRVRAKGGEIPAAGSLSN